mmetsp:Transcript_51789/g.76768  ORF Transcript_51789/g.76768 Transcript_51789/m.76768 type:complete len:499 (-) Transcript_51789:243-1739(-)
MMSDTDELAPLRGLLDSVLSRLQNVEDKIGIASNTTASSTSTSSAAAENITSPAVDAYDAHVTNAVLPLTSACDAIKGLKKYDIGDNIQKAWAGIRDIVELSSRCQKPKDVQKALMPHLKTTQDAISAIRSPRLDRSLDQHQKALVELLPALSWILISPPPQPPATFVKETLGATEFWSNKIRKINKGVETEEAKAHLAFCEGLKKVILDLTTYIKEFHLSGLSWNPRGVSFEEGEKALSSSSGGATTMKAPAAPAIVKTDGSGIGDVMKELSLKKTSDGSSAATGLKTVGKDQQTWRKEFDKNSARPVPTSAGKLKTTPVVTKAKAAAPTKSPVFEYQQRGQKYKVEYQTKENNTGDGGIIKIDIKDSKEQVYIFKCQDITIDVHNKLKTIIIDDCKRVNVVFDTAMASCEVVNCQRIQLQTRQSCPTFSIDKTDGCLVYLSAESVGLSSFMTSKSSEMNVSWPDENGAMKEAPIPEQFQHKLVNGKISSAVSDLYH